MKADQVCLFESGAPVPLLTRKAQKFPTPLAISFPTTFPRKAGEIGKMGGNGGEMGTVGEHYGTDIGNMVGNGENAE